MDNREARCVSIPGMDVWYKTHGVEKVTPVTCETLNSIETDNGKDNDKEKPHEPIRGC